MQDNTIPPELLAHIESVTGKRAKIVLDHIRLHGYVTNLELKQTYGYDHPPRAIRDVRENGIPLETFKIDGPDGRKITAYRFPTNIRIEERKSGGRHGFTKKLKQELLARNGEQCMLCGGRFSARSLQIDHKVPYEVASDQGATLDIEEFMLVCGSCNRAKSWDCEHCDNWKHYKLISTCHTCMWCSPNNYTHIALKQKRSLTLNWNGEEVQDYNHLVEDANEADQPIDEYVKSVLKKRKHDRRLEE